MRKAQTGASYITILVAVVAFAFILKAIVALWPAYWDDQIINKQIETELKESPSMMTANQFSTQMSQNFSMNNIRDLNFNDIARVSTEQGLQVAKKYEVRKPFLLNIDIVLTFEKSFDQRSVQSK